MKTEWVSLAVSDGTTMAAYLARPESGPARGVLVFQEAFGVNGHIQDVARRLAEQGWCALAPDLFHRTAPRFDLDYSDFRPAMPHMKAMTMEGQKADLRACHDWMVEQHVGQVAAIGFCMGGRMAALAAQVLPLQAAASFYGGNILSLRESAADTQAPLLLVWGDQDQHIPKAQRDEFADLLRAAGKPFAECTFSAAGHGFFNDQRESYEPSSARVAWALALAFLDRQ
ncbi:MAG: dienelactone hydrolase family protein [Terriglobales bacterium]